MTVNTKRVNTTELKCSIYTSLHLPYYLICFSHCFLFIYLFLASVIHSAPSVELLQSASRLVCLVYGFSPSAINITWLLGTTEVSAHNDTNPAKGPDGKFSIRSYLQLLPAKWAPGEVYSCRITHATGTQLHNISKSGIKYFMH